MDSRPRHGPSWNGAIIGDEGSDMAYGRGDGTGFAAGLMAAIVVALGIGVGGTMIGSGIVEARLADSRATVNGLAEREVKADLAVWPLTITATGDDLGEVQQRIDTDVARVRDFLVSSGFDEAEVSLAGLHLEDRVAQNGNGSAPSGGRYLINQPVRVRSTNVDLVAQVSRELGALVREGVVLTGWERPSYVFTRLNEIKPDMLLQATENAEAAALAFANSSGARLGEIRTASQGVFVILPRDEIPGETESAQVFKRVRVVSTVTYQLER